MNIQYASDLHLEFRENKEYMLRNPLPVAGDILIMAGDVMPFAQLSKHEDFLDYLADNFEQTYWLPGNHEYYGGDIAQRSGSFVEEIRPNVHLVNNHSVILQDCIFVFSTLWSKVSPANEWQVQQSLNDYHSIKYNNSPFKVSQSNRFHLESLAFIKQELKTKHAKKVVATHHVPTMMHYPAQYRGDALNEAFATELFDFIEELQPDYWLYGHHHSNTPDFSLSKTQLLTNQLGYVQYGEHLTFDSNKYITL